MRKVYILLGFGFLAAATALPATRTFTQEFSTDWHDRFNWSPNDDYPRLGDDAIIPDGKVCIISTDDGMCRTVSVTGDLVVTGGQTLQIRTPNSGSVISMTVNAGAEVRGNDGVIRLEDDGGDDIARITGSGMLTGGWTSGPGTLETDSGSYAVDWVHVDEDSTVFGDWYITTSIDNDGAFVTGGDHLYMTFDPPSTATITGSGLFTTLDGIMTFGCIDFASGTMDATFACLGGDMEFDGCGAFVKAELLEAALIVDGSSASVDFADGFTMDGGTVHVSDGFVLCHGDTILADTEVTIDGDGVFGFDTANFKLNSGTGVVVEETGTLATDLLVTGQSGDGITITIDDGGEFSCDWFEFNETELTILSGTFDVAVYGSNNTPSLGSSTTAITISGGTFSIAWGYDGDGAELTLAGGTIEVLASADANDTFFNDGDSLYLSGTIEVKEGEKLILD
jgi:hypothetical protein